MCDNKEAVRFRHHFLVNGGVLSVCTSLNHENRTVTVGWSIFNPEDDRWVRKVGNGIAKKRMAENPTVFTLSKDEPVICDYISLRALVFILGTSKRKQGSDLGSGSTRSIPRQTLEAIQFEVVKILSLLGERVGLPSIVRFDENDK